MDNTAIGVLVILNYLCRLFFVRTIVLTVDNYEVILKDEIVT